MPLASYAPDYSQLQDRDRERAEKVDPQVVLKLSGLDIQMNKPEGENISDKEFEQGLEILNEEFDKLIEKRNVNLIFTLGTVGFLMFGLGSLVLVFLFKNRKLQIRLGIVLFVFQILTISAAIFATVLGSEVMTSLDVMPNAASASDVVTSYKIGFFLMPIIAISTLIGIILVRRDDNLVKSLDRLR